MMKFTHLSQLMDQIDTFLGRIYIPLLALGVIITNLFARKAMLSFQSGDYITYLSPWYDFIKAHGGFAALKYNFADYNPPYLYFLTFVSYLPLKKIWAIKGISIAFDFFLAFTIYLLVNVKYSKRAALTVAMGTLFLPTILLNSTLWGQSDAMYVSFCLLSLYFIIKKKGAFSCIAAGIALSLKLQTIFFLPILLIAVIKKEIRATYLLLIPLVYGMMLLPAILAGRSIQSLLDIYLHQSGEGAGYLTLNATNFYQWIPNRFFTVFNSFGIYFTLGLVLLVIFVIAQFSDKLTRDTWVKVTMLMALIIPFFLPQMHDRYFYLAETMSIVYAIYFPRYIYLPILLQIPALCVYFNFLLQTTPLPEIYLPFFLLAAMVIVAFDLVKQLMRQSAEEEKQAVNLPDPSPDADQQCEEDTHKLETVKL